MQGKAANAARFLGPGGQSSRPAANVRPIPVFSIVGGWGALYRALPPLRRYRTKMAKIESPPSKRKAWEYFFFVDCDGHVSDHKVAKAIGELEQQCSFVKVLGSYPNAE